MIEKKPFLRELLENIIIAVFIAVLIETYILGFAVIHGRSMYPTFNTDDRLVVMKFFYLLKKPETGDIIIFNPPQSNGKELFVKRIIASEYEHFDINAGDLYINDKKVYEEYVNKEEYWNRDYVYEQGVVPSGMVFVMGDNRNDSNDSRNFGFVRKEQIKGKVILKIWPLDRFRVF